MSTHKGLNIIRFSAITSTLSLLFIAILLIPISLKAFYWGRCFNNTLNWIDEKRELLEGWDRAAKESLAVGVCNGAVYEPVLKTK